MGTSGSTQGGPRDSGADFRQQHAREAGLPSTGRETAHLPRRLQNKRGLRVCAGTWARKV